MDRYVEEAQGQVQKAYPDMPHEQSVWFSEALVTVARGSGASVDEVIREAQHAENG